MCIEFKQRNQMETLMNILENCIKSNNNIVETLVNNGYKAQLRADSRINIFEKDSFIADYIFCQEKMVLSFL